jgi:hypothetical protein
MFPACTISPVRTAVPLAIYSFRLSRCRLGRALQLPASPCCGRPQSDIPSELHASLMRLATTSSDCRSSTASVMLRPFVAERPPDDGDEVRTNRLAERTPHGTSPQRPKLHPRRVPSSSRKRGSLNQLRALAAFSPPRISFAGSPPLRRNTAGLPSGAGARVHSPAFPTLAPVQRSIHSAPSGQ